MADRDPNEPKKADIRSIAATAPDDPLVDNAAHLLGEIRRRRVQGEISPGAQRVLAPHLDGVTDDDRLASQVTS